MENSQLIKVVRGDNQLIAAPQDTATEVHCVAGRAVLRSDRQRMDWPLRAGLTLKLRPGSVYRVDARTNVELMMAPAV